MADETEKTGGLEGSSPQPPAGSNAAAPADPGAAASAPAHREPLQTGNRADEIPLRDDIAKILAGVKLPERRDPSEGKRVIPNPAPVMPEEPASTVPPPKTGEDAGQLGTVHTLRQDLQEVVRDQKVSLVSAVALEQSKKRPEAFELPQKPKRNIAGIVFAVFMLLLLGGAALGGVYYVVNSNAAPAPTSQIGNSIVFSEQTATFPLTGEKPALVKQELASARSSTRATLGSITRIVPTIANADGSVRAAAFSEFMTSIGATPPADLLRALSDDFFFGIHTVDKNSPVIVIPVASYDQAFAGMLEWEKTMNDDLSPIFTQVPDQVTGADGLQAPRTFTDLVMRNFDVRALKDDAGQVELYYSFPTRGILVIAESPYTFTEVLSRLQAERRL